MGWFDEQIRERMRRDQDSFEDVFVRVTGSVLGSRAASKLQLGQRVTKEALDDILRYYDYRPVEIPSRIEEVGEQLEYVLRPLGLMTRDVVLKKGWHRNASGPMLGFLSDSGSVIALLPGKLCGYWYTDPASGRRVRVSARREKLISEEALCFYKPLPMKKLGVSDLLRYMKNSISGGDLTLILLSALGLTLTGLVEPLAYKALAGPILNARAGSVLTAMAVFLLCAAFSSELLAMIHFLLIERVSQKASLDVEASVMIRILSLPVSFFRTCSAGELSTRAESVGNLCRMLLDTILSSGLSAILALIYLFEIFSFTPVLTRPCLVILLVMIGFTLATAYSQLRVSRKKVRLSARETGMSYAMLSGIQKIRLAGAEKRAFSRWGRLYAQTVELEYDPPLFLKLSEVFRMGILLAGNLLLYYVAASHGVAPSAVFAFTAAYGRLMGAFSQLSRISVSIGEIPPVLEMAEPILKAEPEVTAEKEVISRISGNIEVDRLFFRYEEKMPYLINGLSLKVRAGEYVAIVGKTGCGKSTLFRLLLGFEKPDKGAIYYDGRDLERIDARSLRKKIGVVTQNSQLFQADIFSNITISAPFLTLADAWDAAETAGIAQDIREMPMGMNTMISEGAGGISGGQKQRIMIARAIAPRPRILLLDEATSALDNKTQRQVAEALDSLKCTRIVIAHRLSTVRNCDRILVMDRGRIVEEGNYQQLIEKNGLFADLVSRQRLDSF